MNLSKHLNDEIANYIESFLKTRDRYEWKSFILSVCLDDNLFNQIFFDARLTAFCQLLISELTNYGLLKDGREPLEAVLNAMKQKIGKDKAQFCDILINEYQYRRQAEKMFVSGYQHDIIVSYSISDNEPDDKFQEGWVTKLTDDLRNHLNNTVKGEYSLSMVCMDYNGNIPHAFVDRDNKLDNAAIVVIVLPKKSYSDQNELISLINKYSEPEPRFFLINRGSLANFPDRTPYYIDKDNYITKLREIAIDLKNKLEYLRLKNKYDDIRSELFETFINLDSNSHLLKSLISPEKWDENYGQNCEECNCEECEYFKKCEMFLFTIYGKVSIIRQKHKINEPYKINYLNSKKYGAIYYGHSEDKSKLRHEHSQIEFEECCQPICENEILVAIKKAIGIT